MSPLDECESSLQRLQLPDGIGDEHPGDGIEPTALMPDLHVLPGIWTPLKGYDRLPARLRSLGYREPGTNPAGPPGNLLPVAYDWRLSCRYNGRTRTPSPWSSATRRYRSFGGTTSSTAAAALRRILFSSSPPGRGFSAAPR